VYNLIKKVDYIIYKGNNILDFINPYLIIYLKKKSQTRKVSARKAEKMADIIIVEKIIILMSMILSLIS